jgi:hypothetical protein
VSAIEDPGVDVVLFVAAGFRLGTDASSVVRVSKRRAEDPAPYGFGPVQSGGRAMIARGSDGGTRSVAVDTVLGVRRIRQGALRPLPGFLKGLIDPAVIGFALTDEAVVALVDLSDVDPGGKKPGPSGAESTDLSQAESRG